MIFSRPLLDLPLDAHSLIINRPKTVCGLTTHCIQVLCWLFVNCDTNTMLHSLLLISSETGGDTDNTEFGCLWEETAIESFIDIDVMHYCRPMKILGTLRWQYI